MPEPVRASKCLTGPLGEAMDLSVSRRLKTFICDEESKPVAMFSRESRSRCFTGDWYGEHAGKWLCAASMAAKRTEDDELAETVRRVARFIVGEQEEDGYMGTYAPEAPNRFTAAEWAGGRTWDVWTHAYLILGLIQAHRLFPNEGFLQAASKAADLLAKTFSGGDRLLSFGNHDGLSAAVLLDPIVCLYLESKDERFLAFARDILRQIEAHPKLNLVERALRGDDAATLGTGKIYQLIWTFVGIAKLHRATGEARLLEACLAFFANVKEHHLTLGGGPWGGIAKHSECFNDRGFFSPDGFVETCSALVWIELCHELLDHTHDVGFADEIERSAWNTILGALDENCHDWSYFTFPNGRRNSTYDWACCKSSGALALEVVASLAVELNDGTLRINLPLPGRYSFSGFDLTIATRYPAERKIDVKLEPKNGPLPNVEMRIPNWAGIADSGSYVTIDTVASFSFDLKVVPIIKAESVFHHSQEIVHDDYLGATYGPIVLAAAPFDGYKRQETLHVPFLFRDSLFNQVSPVEGMDGPCFEFRPIGRTPISLAPYYEAGGRSDGKWRTTWLSVAIQ